MILSKVISMTRDCAIALGFDYQAEPSRGENLVKEESI